VADIKKAKRTVKSGNVKLDDVAEYAGVSRSTASLVVRNSPLIKPATHKKVRAAMKALGYVYNQSAANLRTNRTKTLGMVIADLSNPFYAELASGIQAECGDQNYLTIFADTRENSEQQKLIISRLIEHNVAGVFLCPAGKSSVDDIKALEAAKIPVVLIMRYLDGDYSSYVGPDNLAGMDLIMNHLIELGHKRIGYIGGPPRRSSSIDRLKGYKLGLSKNGLKFDRSIVASSEINRQAAMAACEQILNNENPPTAVACYNDVMAFGAFLTLYKKGLIPGKDIALAGFDNIPEASLWTPALTTVSIDAKNIGRLAAAEILHHIGEPDRPKQKIIVQPKFIARESTVG
jgi:LacI family transcriptional regulator